MPSSSGMRSVAGGQSLGGQQRGQLTFQFAPLLFADGAVLGMRGVESDGLYAMRDLKVRAVG